MSLNRVFVFVGRTGITVEMKIKKKSEKRGIEECIEAPTVYPGASSRMRRRKVVVEHQNRHREAKQELHNLAIRHDALPPRSDPERAEEVVAVHDHVHGGVGHERHGEE